MGIYWFAWCLKFDYFLRFSRFVTGIYSRPCSYCILKEYTLPSINMKATWQASFLKSREQADQCKNFGETEKVIFFIGYRVNCINFNLNNSVKRVWIWSFCLSVWKVNETTGTICSFTIKEMFFCRSFIFTGVKVGSSTGNRIWLRVWDGGGVWAARVVPSRLLQGPRKRGEERGTRISRQQDHIPYRRHGWWCNHHTIREHLTRKALRERLINQALFISNTWGVSKSFINVIFYCFKAAWVKRAYERKIANFACGIARNLKWRIT